MANNTYSQTIKGNFLSFWNGVSKVIKPVIAAVNGYAVSFFYYVIKFILSIDIIYYF